MPRAARFFLLHVSELHCFKIFCRAQFQNMFSTTSSFFCFSVLMAVHHAGAFPVFLQTTTCSAGQSEGSDGQCCLLAAAVRMSGCTGTILTPSRITENCPVLWSDRACRFCDFTLVMLQLECLVLQNSWVAWVAFIPDHPTCEVQPLLNPAEALLMSALVNLCKKSFSTQISCTHPLFSWTISQSLGFSFAFLSHLSRRFRKILCTVLSYPQSTRSLSSPLPTTSTDLGVL